MLLTPSSPPERLLWSADYRLYLVDDCDQLDPAQQQALFHLINQVRENGSVLILSARHAPLQLALREDLRTRLGWGLVYQVHGLSDEEKVDALSKSAAARGLSLSAGVVPYLLTHFRRDMQSLSTMLDALDRYSLETQRPITLPLLRELLQTSDYTTEP
jgi:DnaA family protein